MSCSIPIALLCLNSFKCSAVSTPNSNYLNYKTVKSSIIASVKLLEVYNTLTPLPGSPNNHPKGHAVMQLRLENTIPSSIYIKRIKVRLVRVSNHKTMNYRLMFLAPLLGLQIEERDNQLILNEILPDAQYKVILEYIIGDELFLVESNQLRPIAL